MANAVLALGGVIGLGLAIPLVTSLIPPNDANADPWSPLTPDEIAALKKATDNKPVKVTFMLHESNGYFGAVDLEQFFWAIRADEATMRKKRPQLFEGIEKVPYPVVNLGFVVFSPICPHLGCKYTWTDSINKFACPCHGSQFTNVGEHVAGPALRGLDPLPLRDFQGKVQVEWIEYKQNTPDHIILKVG
ncbi:MAG TPA: Rieske 2Fe-2S domain-containing protein [Candidatus Elarobacter sp.]|jgi:menaquinol-cytochrome c reductase iron-sulfur subunit|nr:Rieske 2Fe-2S domain-containing protein [Candidatus Elarobacter sp.]